ncbi:MAG: NUDIX domain-containing protein [Hyphomicrobiaceae bacterium]|nr:NUDIX domain-containing protein [Hyphomicrobiaceae bacterium]
MNGGRGSALPRAAVSACVFRDGELLLVKRAKPPFVGAWSLPGGSIEPGETAEAAIVREIAEETRLAITVAGVAGVNDVIARDTTGADTVGSLLHHYVIVVFAASVHTYAPAPVAASDAADARFYPLNAPEVASLGRRVGAIVGRASTLIAAVPA